jgi:hypothetical protein
MWSVAANMLQSFFETVECMLIIIIIIIIMSLIDIKLSCGGTYKVHYFVEMRYRMN